jgi:hypothetical protein
MEAQMKSQSETQSTDQRQAGAKIPDQPRDCAPHVDTWPILDADGAHAAKPKAEDGGRKSGG